MRRVSSLLVAFAALAACGARTELTAAGACTPLETSLQVPSESPWSDTGIDVVPGMTLTIEASGVVSYYGSYDKLTGPDGGNWDGQKYFADAVLPHTIVVSLIGKVGGSTAEGTGTPIPEGTPGDGTGYVGSAYQRVLPMGGRLFLGFNDQNMASAFADNSGSFHVRLSLRCGP